MLTCSVKLVEQELWQKEDKGLIGVLPVRDAEAATVGSLIAPGDLTWCTSLLRNCFDHKFFPF